jgi:hypothetical protein
LLTLYILNDSLNVIMGQQSTARLVCAGLCGVQKPKSQVVSTITTTTGTEPGFLKASPGIAQARKN